MAQIKVQPRMTKVPVVDDEPNLIDLVKGYLERERERELCRDSRLGRPVRDRYLAGPFTPMSSCSR